MDSYLDVCHTFHVDLTEKTIDDGPNLPDILLAESVEIRGSNARVSVAEIGNVRVGFPRFFVDNCQVICVDNANFHRGGAKIDT